MDLDLGGVGRIAIFSTEGIFLSAFFKISGSTAPSGHPLAPVLTLAASREGVLPRENVRVEREADELRWRNSRWFGPAKYVSIAFFGPAPTGMGGLFSWVGDILSDGIWDSTT